MFLEWWQLGVLALATGMWAEYRNSAGYQKGLRFGIESLLTKLHDERVIEIDNDGKIFPYKQKGSFSAARRKKRETTE
jgi:hypothetical protein